MFIADNGREKPPQILESSQYLARAKRGARFDMRVLRGHSYMPEVAATVRRGVLRVL